jgi:hypothetical protein
MLALDLLKRLCDGLIVFTSLIAVLPTFLQCICASLMLLYKQLVGSLLSQKVLKLPLSPQILEHAWLFIIAYCIVIATRDAKTILSLLQQLLVGKGIP